MSGCFGRWRGRKNSGRCEEVGPVTDQPGRPRTPPGVGTPLRATGPQLGATHQEHTGHCGRDGWALRSPTRRLLILPRAPALASLYSPPLTGLSRQSSLSPIAATLFPSDAPQARTATEGHGNGECPRFVALFKYHSKIFIEASRPENIEEANIYRVNPNGIELMCEKL